MKKIVKHSCGAKVVLNTGKHRHRPKWCPKCRKVVDNLSPKARVLSFFQKFKKERKEDARKRYVDKMSHQGYSLDYIAKRMTKTFDWEEK